MKKILGFGVLLGMALAGAVQADALSNSRVNAENSQRSDRVNNASNRADHAAYVGVSFGATKSTYLSDEIKSVGLVVKSHEWGKGGKIYFGVPVGPTLDLRASYADLGRVAVKGVFNQPPASGDMSGSIETQGIYGEALLKLTFNGYKGELYAKLGAGIAFARQSASATSSGVTIDGKENDSGASFSLGVGWSYLLNEHWGVRAEGERYFINIKDEDDDNGFAKMKVDLVSAGVYYRF